MKRPSSTTADPAASARTPPKSPFAAAEPVLQVPPLFDIKEAVMVDASDGDDGDDADGDDDDGVDFSEALEEAIVGLGYDSDDGSRRKLE
eukprot:5633019-Prymnesium_polylepis.1